MDDDKRTKILDAAIKIFAKDGYSQATMEKISAESELATSLMYFHFKGGKLEILLSIFVNFWQNINRLIYEGIALKHDPYDKLACLINIIYLTLTKDHKALCVSKVLGEHIPFVLTKDSDSLKEKRRQITNEINKLIFALDGIIAEGQRLGIFIDILKPALIRQMLYGSIQMLIYGCYLKSNRIVKDVGYNKEEAKHAVNVLIARLLIADNKSDVRERKIFESVL